MVDQILRIVGLLHEDGIVTQLWMVMQLLSSNSSPVPNGLTPIA